MLVQNIFVKKKKTQRIIYQQYRTREITVCPFHVVSNLANYHIERDLHNQSVR